jgi:hypothetical protein
MSVLSNALNTYPGLYDPKVSIRVRKKGTEKERKFGRGGADKEFWTQWQRFLSNFNPFAKIIVKSLTRFIDEKKEVRHENSVTLCPLLK